MIPQIEPWIGEEEYVEIKRAINSTYVVEHDLTKEFESMICGLTDSKYAISTCNGTMALYICLKVLGIGEGDEVIVPNVTFIATANAVILCGAKPIFCEVDKKTLCLDVEWAERILTKKTKAIIPVHLYGQSADLDEIVSFSNKYSLVVIEDAAQAIGVTFNGKHVGTFGDMGILSFYGNKTITTGEGGVILTNDPNYAEAAYRLKNHGRNKKGTFIHEHIGFNFSFTDVQAALGISQLKKLPKIIEKKKYICDFYTKELRTVQEMRPVSVDKRVSPVFWFTSFISDNASELETFLLDKEIQTRRFFYPLHLQPCYKSMYNGELDYSISEYIYKKGISLPSSYNLTEKEQKYVVNCIKEFYF